MTSRQLWDPFYEILQTQDRLSKIMEKSLNSFANIDTPAIDVYEEGSQLKIEASLPNFDEKDIDINITSDGLEIKAEHSSESEDKQRHYLVHEMRSNSYYRYVNLPYGANMDEAKASFDNGILKISVPVRELAPSKKLELTSGKTE